MLYLSNSRNMDKNSIISNGFPFIFLVNNVVYVCCTHDAVSKHVNIVELFIEPINIFYLIYLLW